MSENINPNIDHDYQRKRQHCDHSYLGATLTEDPILPKRPRIDVSTTEPQIRAKQHQTTANISSHPIKRLHDDHTYSKLSETLSEGPSLSKRPRIESSTTKNDDHSYAKSSELIQHDPQTQVPQSETSTGVRNLPTGHSQDVPADIQLQAQPQTSKDCPDPLMKTFQDVPADIQIQPQPSTSSTKVASSLAKYVTQPKTPGRRRIVQKVTNLTPVGKLLYQEYRKSQKQIQNFKQRAKRATKFCRENSFQELTKSMSNLSKTIMWMQIQQSSKKQKARRFNNEEKLISLAIMKQSPKAYRFLRKIFILPSKTTLNKMIGDLNVETGINPQIFDSIKQEVHTWDDNKKYCSLLFDEMSLDSALHYNKHKDQIEGFVELEKKSNDFADHALAFMLRGAVSKWQQPIAYYFC